MEAPALPEIILLPGLDGTGDLFEPLLSVLPGSVQPRVIRYPPDQPLSYDALLAFVSQQIRAERHAILVAESFSGPIALRYAAEHPMNVRGLVFCASFVRSPVPRWIATAVKPVLFRLPLPTFAMRLLLLGWRSPASLVKTVRRTIKRVRPEVLAQRIRDVLELDCSAVLAKCAVPILYLQAEQDAIVRGGAVRLIQDANCNVIVRKVPGPHLLLQAEPQRAWTQIADLVSRFSAREPQGEITT